MNSVLHFLRSKTYKNFWKFTLVGALISGGLVSLSFLILAVLSLQSPNLIGLIFIGLLYGAPLGFIAATLGFWIMYFLGQNLNTKKFAQKSLYVGFILACFAISVIFNPLLFVIDPFNLDSAVQLGIPFWGSIYFFRFFSIRYIYPLILHKEQRHSGVTSK